MKPNESTPTGGDKQDAGPPSYPDDRVVKAGDEAQGPLTNLPPGQYEAEQKILHACAEKHKVFGVEDIERELANRGVPLTAAPAPGDAFDGPTLGARDRSGGHNDPFLRRDAAALALALRALGVVVRFNIRAKVPELKRTGPDDPHDWRRATDRNTAKLRNQISTQFWYRRSDDKICPLYFGGEVWGTSLNALLEDREADPFMVWLDARPAHDGTARLDTLLADLFGAAGDDLSRWAGRYLFLGPVQRTYEPGCKLDEMPVLVGAQDIGKSTLLSEAPPPTMPELFSDGLRFDAQPDRQRDAVLGRVIVEVPEMAGRGAADRELIKAFISRRDDGNTRRPYAASAEPLLRMFVLCGTTNNEKDLPNDPSGNRRFVPIPLTRGSNIEAYMRENRDQLWAEALVLYKRGERANLPRDLKHAQAARAEEHRDRNDALEDAITILPKDRNLSPGEIMELLDHMPGGAINTKAQRPIYAELKRQGWESARTAGRRYWVPPQAAMHDTMTPNDT